MSIKKSLGGDRLGSGNKMNVRLHNFERSTHDLGRLWRSTMAAGTLVPYMVEYGLPGDVFNIDLGADVKTYPTVGPLFGSFKLQLDVFQAPIRLYNAMLHNNALGIGMNMSQVKLPELEFRFVPDGNQFDKYKKPFHGKHINSSSIHAYLGIRGLGNTMAITGTDAIVHMNAIPYLAYWDIYKNYYANKQEEIGYVIHTEETEISEGFIWFDDDIKITFDKAEIGDGGQFQELQNWDNDLFIEWLYIDAWMGDINENNVELLEIDAWRPVGESELVEEIEWDSIDGFGIKFKYGTKASEVFNIRINNSDEYNVVKLSKFDLSNIDDVRNEILAKASSSPYKINNKSKAPYNLSLQQINNVIPDTNDGILLRTLSSYYSQEGLGIKTYQSDIFNNWLSTEWIDGTNGINEITAVDTSEGSFKIDTLNLANKVYDMLNRIAVSGGSYDDWIEANWTHTSYRRTESPIYMGGLSKEVVFQEVVSNAAAEGTNGLDPLGTLAGKGGLANKHKGGKVTIKVHEPSVIIGIVSLTPRIDYSQGNEWHVNLKTLDDFHKPGLDGIGFQELITEQMAEWDVIRYDDAPPVRKSAGKQPAWINYQTSFNRTYGNFADPKREMYMTLNRRYEYDELTQSIKDLTTYIDPSKFNYLFADTNLNSQNFWVQIGIDMTVRRKMSAKVMPNL